MQAGDPMDSDRDAHKRLTLLKALEALAQGAGVQRLDIREALAPKGELSALQEYWEVDVSKGLEFARDIVIFNLRVHIRELKPREARQKLSLEQRRQQYANAIAVSFNVYRHPSLDGKDLTGRRQWLDSDPWLNKAGRRHLMIDETTCRRDLKHAISQIVEQIMEPGYEPVHIGPNTENTLAAEFAADPLTLPGNSGGTFAANPRAGQTLQQPHPAQRTHKSTIAILMVVVVALAVVVGVALSNNHGSQIQGSASPGSNTLPGTGVPGASPPSALAVVSAWPYISGCPDYAQVAMPPGMGRIEDFHAVTDVRPTLVSGGAGSWARGILYLDLSPAQGQQIEITNILPHIGRRDLSPPAWIYNPDDGCGPNPSDRIFQFNLDAPKFTDQGLYSNDAAPPDTNMPTAALGPGFTLSGSQHALIRVEADSCHGNYEWNLDIQYVTKGSQTIEHLVTKSFQSYGVANNTTVYSGHQTAPGTIQIDKTSSFTGGAAGQNDPALGVGNGC
jgi:hypothetical protein